MQTQDLGKIVTALEVAAVMLTEDGLRPLSNAELIAEAKRMAAPELSFCDRDLLIVLDGMGLARQLNKAFGGCRK